MTRLAWVYVEFSIGFLAQMVALVTYMVDARGRENGWYRNPVGQFLVTLGVVVELYYVRGFLRHNHDTSTSAMVFYGVIAALMIYWAVVFTVVLRRKRRPREEKDNV